MSRNVLITGGSRGLGRALVLQYALQGDHVEFTYSQDAASAQKTMDWVLEKAGKTVRAHRVSVLDRPGLEALVRDLEGRLGGVDVLINNAGVSQVLPLALMDEEDWDHVMDTNVKGTYLATRSVLRGMIRRKKGVILNIGSLAGMRLLEAPVHYCASKAAVSSFTEALSKEIARYGIRVLCLAPGLLEDGVAKNLPEKRLQEFLEQLALRRVGTLEEVAKCATFLTSDRSSYMNGTTVLMDGGL